MTHSGNTSYQTLPFVSAIYQQSWASSPSLSPANLHWPSGQNFNDDATMANAQTDAAAKTANGIVPSSGCQRWDSTYAASQPPVPGEPAYVTSDRATIQASGEADAFTAWADWINAGPSMIMLGSDGTPNANGHVSPLMPLAPPDWTTGIGATYGDLFAQQWAQTAELSGAYGIMLSDYIDSQPIGPSFKTGFNPEIIAAFATTLGQAIPGATVADCAAYITDNLFNAWTDFLCAGYARFYNALANDISTATGENALVVDQCGLSPSERRLYGTDARLLAQGMSSDNLICIWDNQTFQTGRSGQPMIWSLGGAVMAAAREPLVRNGSNLECDTPAYWAAVAQFMPNLNAADQREWGLKQIKRNWIENAFSHIADRSGNCRRALCFMSRDYWDSGTLDPAIITLIQSVVPTKPFGYAVYYSGAQEAVIEAGVPAAGSINAAYMTPDKLLNFKQAGGAVGYYVSDAGLARAPRPTAYVVLDGPFPPDELLFQSVVVLTAEQALTWPAAPLRFSPGLTGFGFFDQTDQLIIVATNLTDQPITGTATIAHSGKQATDLMSGAVTAMSGMTLPLNIARWDTVVLASQKEKHHAV